MPEAQPTATSASICPTCSATFDGVLQFCPHDGARLTAQAAARSLVGQVLADRYRIVRKIGEGGMGEVFEAQHVYIDKRFALKTLRPEITGNADVVTRFQQEARSASSIGHENIVAVDDFGRLADGTLYLAMEFLEGESLAERMKTPPPMDAGEIVGVMLDVCRGLSAAHAKGIIHRDMKPENVFLARKGTKGHRHYVVKILDFGIAKVVSGGTDQHLTRTGAIFGTPHYMSPEQAMGRPLDHRADIYSVGVILYEAFAGRLPFIGDSFMAILTQHVTAPPQPPSLAAPDRQIPREIEQVILRAMAKEPEQRQPSMDALAEELLAAADAAGVVIHGVEGALAAGSGGHDAGRASVRPSGHYTDRSQPSLGWSQPQLVGGSTAEVTPARKGGSAAILGVSAAVLLAGLGAGAWWYTHRESSTSKPATSHSDTGHTGATAKMQYVLVDTAPSGATMFIDGKPGEETPAVLKIPEGEKRTVTLRLADYVEQTLVIDPSQSGRKVLVALNKLPPETKTPPIDHPTTKPETPLVERKPKAKRTQRPEPSPANTSPGPAPRQPTTAPAPRDPYAPLPPPRPVRHPSMPLDPYAK